MTLANGLTPAVNIKRRIALSIAALCLPAVAIGGYWLGSAIPGVLVRNVDNGQTWWMPLPPSGVISLHWIHSFDLTPVVEEFTPGEEGGWLPVAVRFQNDTYDARGERYAGLPVVVDKGFFHIENISSLYPEEIPVLSVRIGHTIRQQLIVEPHVLPLSEMGEAGDLVVIQAESKPRISHLLRSH